MTTFMQWVHISAAVIGVGGIAFLLFLLIPSARALRPEQRDSLMKILAGKRRVAMQYSPLNNIPYIGLVDAGTIELIRSFGVEPVSSGDLVQIFEARWSPAAFQMHLGAGEVVHAAIRGGFAAIREAVSAGKTITEYDVQQEIARQYNAGGLEADGPPIVGVNANCSNCHYSPAKESALPIRQGDFVILDVWAKMQKPGAVYFDVTWTGYLGERVPEAYAKIFRIVRDARDAAVQKVKQSLAKGRAIHGWEVDRAARELIRKAGYAKYFVHRTGHSIGEDIHGNGANMDNLETHDSRQVLPRTCFSIEPGIYLDDFGVRSEVHGDVAEHAGRLPG